MTDLESALQDRTAELREIENIRETMANELDSVRRGERTREVVGRVFADSLSLVRSHDEREMKREAYANFSRRRAEINHSRGNRYGRFG